MILPVPIVFLIAIALAETGAGRRGLRTEWQLDDPLLARYGHQVPPTHRTYITNTDDDKDQLFDLQDLVDKRVAEMKRTEEIMQRYHQSLGRRYSRIGTREGMPWMAQNSIDGLDEYRDFEAHRDRSLMEIQTVIALYQSGREALRQANDASRRDRTNTAWRTLQALDAAYKSSSQTLDSIHYREMKFHQYTHLALESATLMRSSGGHNLVYVLMDKYISSCQDHPDSK